MGISLSKIIMGVGFRTDFDSCETLGLQEVDRYTILSNYGLPNPMHPYVVFIQRGKDYFGALLTISKASGMARHNLVQVTGKEKQALEQASNLEWVVKT